MKSGAAKGEPAPAKPARQLRLRRTGPWYVPPALQARRTATGCAAALLALGGCGGQKTQDENEPEGNFPIEVVDATFTGGQKLAKRSELEITVRNAGSETVPNVAVTVNGFSERRDNPDLADPERPVFVINGVPIDIGGLPESKEASPRGCETAYVNTWACGSLPAGRERTFRWSVTAVEAGRYEISYRVAAGLDGKAKATPSAGRLSGSFRGSISDEAPDSRVADDGKTVVRGTR
jgi:hypothetical protein